jgi:hypothetical protein
MSKWWPQIEEREWELFQQESLVRLLKDRNFQYGRAFVIQYPEIAEAMAENSNLGTPPGVHHPNDDVILYGIKDNDEAVSFILDRVEIVKENENAETH